MASCGIYESGTVLSMKMAASAVAIAKSGRFVGVNGSGYVSMSTASSVDMIGWLNGTFELTSSSTAGGSVWPIETDFLSKLFVMPACKGTGTALTEAELLAGIGESSDIIMESTNYQYANLAASSVDILLQYGYIYEGSSYGQQYAIVKINPAKLVYTSH